MHIVYRGDVLKVVINFPKNPNDLLILQQNVAYIKAMLILKKVESLDVDVITRKKLLETIISKLKDDKK